MDNQSINNLKKSFFLIVLFFQIFFLFLMSEFAIGYSSKAFSSSYDGTIRRWNLKSGKEVKIYKGHSFNVNDVALSKNGDVMASGSVDETVKIWEVATGRVIKTLNGHEGFIAAVAISPNGSRVLSAGNDKIVRP